MVSTLKGFLPRSTVEGNTTITICEAGAGAVVGEVEEEEEEEEEEEVVEVVVVAAVVLVASLEKGLAKKIVAATAHKNIKAYTFLFIVL